jgi:DNA-binding response OmpR family regulator
MTLPVTPGRKLLLVEDDKELVELLTMHLEAEGYAIVSALDGESGLQAFLNGAWALIILDWMLPGLSGLDLLREIRAHDARTPVLMLTARGDETDKILGLELGCDDYMTKPFSVR